MRICTNCKKEKTDFYEYQSGGWCKDCQKEYNRLAYRKRVKPKSDYFDFKKESAECSIGYKKKGEEMIDWFTENPVKIPEIVLCNFLTIETGLIKRQVDNLKYWITQPLNHGFIKSYLILSSVRKHLEK